MPKNAAEAAFSNLETVHVAANIKLVGSAALLIAALIGAFLAVNSPPPQSYK